MEMVNPEVLPRFRRSSLLAKGKQRSSPITIIGNEN
jgi:hypothetical protein